MRKPRAYVITSIKWCEQVDVLKVFLTRRSANKAVKALEKEFDSTEGDPLFEISSVPLEK